MVDADLCGKFMLEDGFCHMRRTMNHNELIYMTEGEMYICVDNKNFYTVKKGEMLFLKAGLLHYGYKPSEGKVSFFWFHYLSEDEADCNLIPHFTPSRSSYIAELYNQLFRYSQTSKEAFNCAATLLVYEVRMESVAPAAKRNAFAETVRSWLEANATNKITVEKTAAHFGYSPDHISAMMKELTGYSVKNYITHLRINRAIELLLSTQLSAKEISFRCGYEDYRQFLKIFKKHTGTTPIGYRNIYAYSKINSV